MNADELARYYEDEQRWKHYAERKRANREIIASMADENAYAEYCELREKQNALAERKELEELVRAAKPITMPQKERNN